MQENQSSDKEQDTGLLKAVDYQFIRAVRAVLEAEEADPERKRQRERREADMSAAYRRMGPDCSGEAWARQERMLKRARQYAVDRCPRVLAEAVSRPYESDTAHDVKTRLVDETWKSFVLAHRDYSPRTLTPETFAAALTGEGWPSLTETIAGAIERLRGGEKSPTRQRKSPTRQR